MDFDVDFVAVGSGLAGFTAAIVAHDAGLSCVVLEKAELVGGVCAYSQGELWCPGSYLGEPEGRDQDHRSALEYLDFLSGGYAEAGLGARLLELGQEALRYTCERAGVRWKRVSGVPDYYYPMAPGTAAGGRNIEVEPFGASELGEWQQRSRLSPSIPSGLMIEEIFAWGGIGAITSWDMNLFASRLAQDMRTLGPGMMAYFVKAAAVDRSIPVLTSTSAQRLLRDETGRVVGVVATQPDGELTVRARRGVLLATGGYDHNDRLRRMYEHVPTFATGAPPGVDGDHLVMAGELGAEVAVLPSYSFAQVLGFRIPGETAAGVAFWRLCSQVGLPHAILVDEHGQRFCDESFYREHQPRLHDWDGVEQRYRNATVIAILDQNHRDKYPLGTTGPGERLPEGLAVVGETLEELALALGLVPSALVATVGRYNDFCTDGADPDFGRGSRPWANIAWGDTRHGPNPNMGPLEKGPFYGLRLVLCGSGINAAGLRIDRDARVLSVRGEPIPGLYAAGNAAAWTDVGAGYQSGIANTRGLAWGYAAGRHAAGA